MSRSIDKPGDALARAFTARGVRCDRERMAAVADLLLSLVERGVLVACETPIVHNMGVSNQDIPGEVA